MEELRAAGARRAASRASLWRTALVGTAMTLGWAVQAVWDAAAIAASPERCLWPTRWAAFRALGAAALLRNVPPQQFARYRRCRNVAPDAIASFLFPIDLRCLDALNRLGGAEDDHVQNKARFADLCDRLGLPCVPTLACFLDGRAVGVADPASGPQADLFVKATNGRGGEGAQIWRFLDGRYVFEDGETLATAELMARLAGADCIVQPLLADHAALRALGSVALSSLRIVTAALPGRDARAVAAALSLADAPGVATSHRGVMCGVDLATGRVDIVRAVPSDPEPPPEPRRADLLGMELPFFHEAVRLACAAHERGFSAFVALGWDIALTDAGPVLIEANRSWNMGQHQLLHGSFENTALAEAVAELLGDHVAECPTSGSISRSQE